MRLLRTVGCEDQQGKEIIDVQEANSIRLRPEVILAWWHVYVSVEEERKKQVRITPS